MNNQRTSASSLLGCLLAVVLLLAACGPSTPVIDSRGIGGGVSPLVVTENFVEDLDKALKDPLIQQRDQRKRWVDTLADYFAPDERETQRDALSKTLSNFANELSSEVNPGEEFKIELRRDGFEQQNVSGQRALVKIVNGRIYWQVLRDGYQIAWDETPLTQIIGGENVPTVKIGNAWFLTENYE